VSGAVTGVTFPFLVTCNPESSFNWNAPPAIHAEDAKHLSANLLLSLMMQTVCER
jgi:hypothetical protein